MLRPHLQRRRETKFCAPSCKENGLSPVKIVEMGGVVVFFLNVLSVNNLNLLFWVGKKAPVDGGWGTWGSYGACSKTCGGGTQTRHRACDTPAPAHGGHACHGTSTYTQTCQSGACPGVYSMKRLDR